MSQDWGLFTDDIDTDISRLLPSSLKDVWEDDNSFGAPVLQNPNSNFVQNSVPKIRNSTSPPRHPRPFPFAESAPALSFMEDYVGAVPTLEPEITPQNEAESNTKTHYYNVQFHPNRTELFKWTRKTTLHAGNYVVVEADRGYDVGIVVEEVKTPITRNYKQSKEIVRIASTHEISQLPIKEEREKRAKELCQAKADDLGLPMKITSADFQFDGKKLIFYYTASDYVDFRNLVRMLFKTFGMRIWMVWHDGNAPVKDVLQRIEQK